jgi:hypothetical protein
MPLTKLGDRKAQGSAMLSPSRVNLYHRRPKAQRAKEAPSSNCDPNGLSWAM